MATARSKEQKLLRFLCFGSVNFQHFPAVMFLWRNHVHYMWTHFRRRVCCGQLGWNEGGEYLLSHRRLPWPAFGKLWLLGFRLSRSWVVKRCGRLPFAIGCGSLAFGLLVVNQSQYIYIFTLYIIYIYIYIIRQINNIFIYLYYTVNTYIYIYTYTYTWIKWKCMCINA